MKCRENEGEEGVEGKMAKLISVMLSDRGCTLKETKTTFLVGFNY